MKKTIKVTKMKKIKKKSGFLLKTILVSTVVLTTQIHAKEFITEIEPYKTHYIHSDTMGKVNYINEELEKTLINKPTKIIQIDKKTEEIELTNITKKLKNQIVIYKNLDNVIEGIKKSTLKSKNEKLTQENNLLNMKNGIIDMVTKKDLLKDKIERKKIEISKNMYINQILVNQGEYVKTGTKLLEVLDLRKTKINFYLTKEEIKSLKRGNYKLIGMSNKKSVKKEWTIERIGMKKDRNYISGFKVEMVNDSKDNISNFIKLIISREK